MIPQYLPKLMRHFPGVPWNAWGDLPYELVMGCIDEIDGGSAGTGE